MPKSSMQMQPIVRVVIPKIKDYLKKNNISITYAASISGVSQPNISKILGGKVKKANKDIELLCKYANIEFPPTIPDAFSNQKLATAINKVWDGTDETVDLLVRLLECAAHIRKR